MKKTLFYLLPLISYLFMACSTKNNDEPIAPNNNGGGNDNTNSNVYPQSYKDSIVNGMPVFVFDKGLPMPRLGLGTQWLEGDKTAHIAYALQQGYRHLDTAHAYNTETNVGEAIRNSGVPRNEIWVTTKLMPSDYRPDRIAGAIDRMLARLGLEYVDLLYIHHPYGNYLNAWPVLEQAVRDGKVKHLGLSNFELRPALIKEVFDRATIKPVIMQIECNPYAQRPDVQQLIKQYGMAQENWFPLGGPNQNQQGFSSRAMRTSDPVLNAIGQAHGKSAVQVILRWHLQRGFSAVPGTSGNRTHISDNITITDFTLTDEEMNRINALSKDGFRFWPATYESMRVIENMDIGE